MSIIDIAQKLFKFFSKMKQLFLIFNGFIGLNFMFLVKLLDLKCEIKKLLMYSSATKLKPIIIFKSLPLNYLNEKTCSKIFVTHSSLNSFIAKFKKIRSVSYK